MRAKASRIGGVPEHDLLRAVGATGGNLVNDAHVAALAVEHRAGVVSFDYDFGRFPGVAWTVPTA